MNKVIITCAVTGAIHTPSMSPYLPVTPEEIIEASVEAANAGAAIIHLHARDPVTGKPDQSPEAFGKFLPHIKSRTNAVLNLTSGGSPFMKIDERIQPSMRFSPEVASLNLGSFNFALFPMLDRFTEFEHAWEREHLENSRDLIFRNTFKDIEYALRACAENDTRFELECYDIGHLYNLAHFANKGIIKPPFFIQSVFGILGGIGPHPEDVMHMRRTADRFAVSRVLANSDRIEQGDFPLLRRLLREAGEAGLLGIESPEAYGGAGVDPLMPLVGLEAMMRCGSTGVVAGLGSHNIALPPVLILGDEVQRQRFVPPVLRGERIAALAITEPGCGSDVAGLRTRAVRDGDHYVLDGTKLYRGASGYDIAGRGTGCAVSELVLGAMVVL
jgi:uncharacterized protein (DUF849 family)